MCMLRVQLLLCVRMLVKTEIVFIITRVCVSIVRSVGLSVLFTCAYVCVCCVDV